MPNGEASYNPFKDIALIRLNVGGFFFVNKIGINAADVITETNIKG